MVKKILKILAIVIVAGLIVSQLFRIDRSAPPIVQNETLQAAVKVPPDIDMILTRSCGDCHTNATNYPWYTNLQPAAWFMKYHIDDGRRHLNLSVFNTYTAKKQRHKLEELCDQVKSGAMPLPSYLWIHRDVVLTESESKALCKWTDEARAAIKEES